MIEERDWNRGRFRLGKEDINEFSQIGLDLETMQRKTVNEKRMHYTV